MFLDKILHQLKMLFVVTALLFIMFIPVFNSYKSDDVKQIETIEMHISDLQLLRENTTQENQHEYSTQIADLQQQKNSISEPLEQKRMFLLIGAFCAVVGGLLFAKKRSKHAAAGWGRAARAGVWSAAGVCAGRAESGERAASGQYALVADRSADPLRWPEPGDLQC